MHFYAVIIGTEILNGRRTDKHFEYLRNLLGEFGHELFASFVIKDDPLLIEQIYRMIMNDPKAAMFSFGGIGSTPDDLTREIASKVFTGDAPVRHKAFEADIIDRFGDEAFPHRIHMADIPVGSGLLKNPVNNMSGFHLEARYFFMPGFPAMSHPMCKEAVSRFFSHSIDKYRSTLIAYTSENSLINYMKRLPEAVELSSLPMFVDGVARVEMSLAGSEKSLIDHWFDLLREELDVLGVDYDLKER
jgi:molybdopterin-biosynthesis enzyme MoeA-like protein